MTDLDVENRDIEKIIARIADYDKIKRHNAELRTMLDYERRATELLEHKTASWNAIIIQGRIQSVYPSGFYINCGNMDYEMTRIEGDYKEGDMVMVQGKITHIRCDEDISQRIYIETNRVQVISNYEPSVAEE